MNRGKKLAVHGRERGGVEIEERSFAALRMTSKPSVEAGCRRYRGGETWRGVRAKKEPCLRQAGFALLRMASKPGALLGVHFG
jgi:hypothetical protein